MKEFKKIIKNIKFNSLIKILAITIIITIICGISVYMQNSEKNNIKINDKEFISEEGKISVYLSGAVNNSGMYCFNTGTRLEEALDIIGGIKAGADISKVNLAKILYDSEKIVIPYIQEEKVVEKNSEETNNSDSEKININNADETGLKTLTGIGDATAKKIIEYRKNGDFETIEDIKKVSGIGDSKYEKIKDKITVE